jgi:aquaporin Z
MNKSKLWRTFTNEMFVTFQMIFIGTGSIVASEIYPELIGPFGIAVCFGLTIYVGIMLFGRISNAHMNPAPTVLYFLCGKINSKITLTLIVAQTIGAFIASFLIYLVSPFDSTLGATLPSVNLGLAWGIEFSFTSILLTAACLLNQTSVPKFGIVLGTLAFLCTWIAFPLTGASMNPIRSIAPAILSGHLEHLWIYITAPLSAAGFVYFLNKYFKLENRF